jgi:small-conductance mechanosensitive channel/CRP-like cAMP-binding protein
MIAGVALSLGALLVRALSPNRHVRGRLLASAVVFAVYALLAAALARGVLSAGMREQLATIQPLLVAFGIINALVALIINPWRVDRLPDRFPTIVQDTMVIGLLAIAATVILQEKIFAATAVGAVVIGFALQDTLGNLFAGLAIQIEKPFRVGQWVRIADIDGLVSETTWRACKVRTKAGNFVIVPNSKVSSEIIINYSEPYLDTRIELDIGASYDVPPNDVKAAILTAIEDEPLISKQRAPEVLLFDFAASAITYRVRVWTTDFAADERLRDRVRSAIYYEFRRRGIEIPYPMQVEIERTDRSVSYAVGAAGAATLRSVPIFSALDEATHAQLAASATSNLYDTNDVIVRQGEAGASMFVIVRGEVVVTVDPGAQEVARIGAGGFFGEMSLLTGAARNATVRTTQDSQMLEITADAFRRIVLSNPAAVEQIGTAVAARQAELDQRRAAGTVTPIAEARGKLVDRIRRFFGVTAIA